MPGLRQRPTRVSEHGLEKRRRTLRGPVFPVFLVFLVFCLLLVAVADEFQESAVDRRIHALLFSRPSEL